MKSTGTLLLVRSNRTLCALHLASVGETMRPLPVKPMAGVPVWIDGVAIIRGRATPVIDLGLLLGAAERVASGRFLTLKMEQRIAALAVEEVVGVSTANMPSIVDLLCLLRDAGSQTITTIGTLDAQLLLVLQTYRIVPEDVWQSLQE